LPLKVVPRRDRKLNKLIKAAEPFELPKGRMLYEEGDDSEDLFVVHEGHLCLTLQRAGAPRRQTVLVVGPMEMCGEEALRSGHPRRYDAVVGQRVRLRSLSGTKVLRALRGSPKPRSTLVAAQTGDLSRTLRSCGTVSSVRIADVLLDLARRFGQKEGRKVVIDHWFTHQELADLACVHRSTVTTTLNEWIYEGILKEGHRSVIVARIAELRKQGSRKGRRGRR